MRIVHIIHHYWPFVGGIENVVKALAEGMARLGHEVHVVASTYGAKGRPREEVVNGVHVHRVRSVRLGYPDLTYPLDYPSDLLKSADVVHGHSQNSLFTVKIIERAKRLGVKTVVHFMAVDALNDHPNMLIRWLGPLYARNLLMKAVAVTDVPLARSLRDQELLKKYGVEAKYVPDGIHSWFIAHKYSGDNFREKYGIYTDYVLYVGRLHPLKGIAVLIHAMAYIKEQKGPDLVVIGPGDSAPYLSLAKKLGVDDKVHFLGFVDEETKIGAIDAATAVVIPSISNYVEVYPMAITEAWARGKPVIATKVGGIPYRVKHMGNGVLVPPRDPKALAEAIMLLANDKELAKKLGAEGRRDVHTWEEIIETLMHIYTRE
ncbi:MAG: glycosyltransferase [Pyrobaculum sp.]|jgi:glycosyltransferase involved in cell wall biosynthesis|nr:glycosyltransferase [Pyrobaculum sp.]